LTQSLQILSGQTSPQQAVRTHCPYCAFQCGITLTGHTVAGDATFPVNNGQLCIKGFSAGELLQRTDRVTTPLKRNAAGVLEPVSWEHALDDIASRLLAIRSAHGPDANACFGSGSLTNEKAYLLGKFARVALRTANIDYNGRYCMSSAAAGQNKAFGVDRGMCFPIADIPGAKTVLLWGTNPADTWPPAMQYFDALRAGGGKLIVVDPRRTETARVADVHVQPTPSTDLALANGLLWIAIDENLIDASYIADRTNGFDAVRANVQSYHPAYVEQLTGISYATMRRIVLALADGPTMLLSGRGPEQQSKGVDTVLAMINLMLALGKVGKPNSGFATLTGQGNGQGGREHGQKADQLPGYRLIEDDAARQHIAGVWNINPADLPRKGKSAFELLDSCGESIKSLLVMGSNVLVASPDMNRIRARLQSLDLLVVCDQFVNETAELAHYVLPVMQWNEDGGTMTNFEGRVIRRRPSAAPPATVKSDTTILGEIATRLGASGFQFDSTRDIFNEFRRATQGGLADYSGITYEKIDAQNGVHWPCPSESHAGTPRLFAERFAHADGRARFHPVRHRDGGEVVDDEYPIYFTTGRLREHYNSGSQTRGVKTLTNAHALPKLQMHPQLAAKLNLSDGATAQVESRRGTVDFTVALSSDIRPDTVFAPFHWGGKHAANLLTQGALDPTSRMPEFKLAAVRIRPVPPPQPE
jgi:assimilatory nitrate reductase catalytic subunit